MDFVNPNIYSQDMKQVNCTAVLQNKELWEQFYELGTEMIITKSGRRMFPALRVQLYELDPHAHYCVLLEMVPVGKCRYKYSASTGWAPAGVEEAQSPHRVYVHQESPATGEHWMSQPISFGRMKLTNTPAPPPGHLVLSSMHKYQPRIIIVKTASQRSIAWAPSTSIVFKETQFIAVTAYQNDKITKLKIDNNPFAKGFRENGQSKCKRKRIPLEEDACKECDVQESQAKRSPSESSLSPRIDVCDDSASTASSSPELRQNETNVPYSCPVPTYNYYQYRLPTYQQNYDMYSYYLSQYSMFPPNPLANSPYYPNYHLKPCTDRTYKEKQALPRKVTDFSIDAIMRMC